LIVNLRADWADEAVARTLWLKPDTVGNAQLWYRLTHVGYDSPSLIRAFQDPVTSFADRIPVKTSGRIR